MQGSRLDGIARDLASGEISRRQALQRLAGAGLGLGAAVVPAGVAEAMGGGCPPGRRKCAGRCCPKNARCVNGRCRCKPGFKKCGRKCVDTDTSLRHCGACGNPCAPGEACIDGVCSEPECTIDADCDDGLFCNGAETCVGGTCLPGTPPSCNDGFSCTNSSCDEVAQACVHTPNDALCEEGIPCTTNTCSPQSPGADPATGCLNTPVTCPPGEVCDPITGNCVAGLAQSR